MIDLYAYALDNIDNNGNERHFLFDWGTRKLENFKPEVGKTYEFNILPQKIGSANHPLVVSGKIEEGSNLDFWALDILVHTYIGPNKADFPCLKQYGERCPACEAYEKGKLDPLYKKNEAYTRTVNGYKAKRRTYSFIQEIVDSIPSPTIKFLNISHSFFGKHLIAAADAAIRGKGMLDFANVKTGKIVSVKGSKPDVGTTPELTPVTFFDRDSEIEQSVLDQVFQLDATINRPSIAEVEQFMLGVDFKAMARLGSQSSVPAAPSDDLPF